MAGRLDVDNVLAELSVSQLAEWQAYYQLEPFGGDWHRTALMASVFAEANRDAEKKAEPFSVQDFLPPTPEIEDEAEEEAEEEPQEDVFAEDAPWRVWKMRMQAMAEARATPPLTPPQILGNEFGEGSEEGREL